jgi:hypothetical protein
MTLLRFKGIEIVAYPARFESATYALEEIVAARNIKELNG